MTWRLLVAVALAAGVGLVGSSALARTLHYQVTVTVAGPGHVTAPAPDSTSGSINCPTQCSALMKQNTTVTFTAVPNSGARFTGWGGDCASAGTSTTCAVSMTGQGGNGSKSITAGFNTPPPPPPMFTLTAKKIGTGKGFVGGGGIDCGKTCSKALVQGTRVTLLAVPDSGYVFLGWSGGCSGSGSCAVTVKTNTNVAATFVDPRRPYVVTLPAFGHAGASLKLRYRAWAKRGVSAERLTIGDGRSVLGRISILMGKVTYRHVYSVLWRVPAGTPSRTLRFCAVAVDQAGKRSPRSCSPVYLGKH